MKLDQKILNISVTAGLISLLAACATVPETGRSQFLLISPAQETQLGLTEFQKLKSTAKISTDAAASSRLRQVGQRISAIAPLPNAQWEFVLFENTKTPNAFCLPGGKVGVFSAILPITQNDAGLATVIGHEVAHAVARHGAERMSQGLAVQMGGQILGSVLQSGSNIPSSTVMQAYGIGSSLAVTLPHSRKQELEADYLGLLYMARAGYDPREAIGFWQRFSDYSKRHGGEAPAFLSTHPLDATRINQLHAKMPKALAEYRKARRR